MDKKGVESLSSPTLSRLSRWRSFVRVHYSYFSAGKKRKFCIFVYTTAHALTPTHAHSSTQTQIEVSGDAIFTNNSLKNEQFSFKVKTPPETTQYETPICISNGLREYFHCVGLEVVIKILNFTLSVRKCPYSL